MLTMYFLSLKYFHLQLKFILKLYFVKAMHAQYYSVAPLNCK